MCLVILIILLTGLYLYGTRNHNYWKKRGVKSLRALPFFGHDARRVLPGARRALGQLAADHYARFPDEPYVGYYSGNVPALIIKDPDLIKLVLVKDFQHFDARAYQHYNISNEPLLQNIFFMTGDRWRALRNKLTPAFSSGKLRAMFPLVVERARRLQARLEAGARAGPGGCEHDALELIARYTTDIIGACGFGLDADSLNDEDSSFRKLGVKIFEMTPLRSFKVFGKFFMPKLFGSVKYLGQDVEEEIIDLVTVVQKRRGYRMSERNDFIDLLMQLKQRGVIGESSEQVRDSSYNGVEFKMDDSLMAAQAFAFFAGGFETSSTTTSFTLYLLACNQDVQNKVHDELDKVLAKHSNELNYDSINEMTYLEWAFMESMRIYPTTAFLTRACSQKYTFPGEKLSIDKGVFAIIPLQALHMDSKYFDNPEEFRPERFAPEEVAKRHKCVYLPFGCGPKSCIAERLGMMQSMAGLAAVLARFRVSCGPRTPQRLVFDQRALFLQKVVGGIPLVFCERTPGTTK